MEANPLLDRRAGVQVLGINSPQLGDAMNPKSDRWEQMMRSTGNKL